MADVDDDEHYREKNSEISRHYGNALVRNFREVYGPNFASGHADTATLREVINQLDSMSLNGLHRDHDTGRLYQRANLTTVVWGRRPL